MTKRINAEGFTVKDVAHYINLGYVLRLTQQGWVMFKLDVIEGGRND